MIISKENNAFVISGIFDGTLRNGKVCFPMNTTALVIDGRDIVRFIDAVSQDELYATPLRTLVYDGEFVTRETLFEDFDAVATAAGGGPGPGPSPEPEMDWFTINNLVNNDVTVTLYKDGSPDNISLKVSNDGTTWTEYNDISATTTFILPANGYLKFNGRSNDHWSKSWAFWEFRANGPCTVSGNLNTLVADEFTTSNVFSALFRYFDSLIDASRLVLPWRVIGVSSYAYMFQGCTSLTTPPELPARGLADNCYQYMFNGCTSLTTAPALPATTLTRYCYNGMFYGCTSLTTAPALPATSVYWYSYDSMFYGCTSLTTAPSILPATVMEKGTCNNMFKNCTSLTTAPELPATIVGAQCYYSMFEGCTSLTTPPSILPATGLSYRQSCYGNMFKNCTSLTTTPELPATTLYSQCYYGMFQNCTSLTTAPELPATTLVSQCYAFMFYGCQRLNNIKCLAENLVADATAQWVIGVDDFGTFECAAGMGQTWPTGIHGIPDGWTVVEAA